MEAVELVSCDGQLVEPLEALPEGAKLDGEGGALLTLGPGFKADSLVVWPAISLGRPMAPRPSMAMCPEAWQLGPRREMGLEQGIVMEVLYPTWTLVAVDTAEIFALAEHAAARWNDWVMEQWQTDWSFPLYMCAVGPPILLEADLRRAKQLGFKGVVFPHRPWDSEERRWRDYLPEFQLAADLGLPIHWMAYRRPIAGAWWGNAVTVGWESFRAAQDLLLELVMDGIFEAVPSLKVVFARMDVGWVQHAAFRLHHIAQRLKERRGTSIWQILDNQVAFVGNRPNDLWSGTYNRALWGWAFPSAMMEWPHEWRAQDRQFVAEHNVKAREWYGLHD